MDNFENDLNPEQQDAPATEIPVAEQQESVYRESPFADSPYVMAAPEAAQQKKVKEKKKRGSKKVLKVLLCSLLILAVTAGSCFVTAMLINAQWEDQMELLHEHTNNRINALQEQIKNSNNSGNSVSGTPNTTADGSLTPGQVYAANVRSVVMIHNKGTMGTSTGSGFILSEDGYVVTNHHVVEGATQLTFTTHDGKSYTAKLIGSDSANDVALLKAEATGLQVAKIGSSDALIVGDQVVAIGNPLGELTSTLTVGYISAKERTVTTSGLGINMLQTDAAINSGNSGGPLFNMKGEVVGITTAKYSGTSTSGASIEGIGFAIPIDDVIDLLTDLKEFGYVTGAYLGVSVSDTDSQAASYFGMPVGAYVHGTEEGSCSQEAGIREKDIIVNLGGYEVSGVSDLTRTLRKFKPGEKTTITVFRSGREVTLSIVLDEKPKS